METTEEIKELKIKLSIQKDMKVNEQIWEKANLKRRAIPFEFIDSEVNSEILEPTENVINNDEWSSNDKFAMHDNYKNNFTINSSSIKKLTVYFNKTM